MRCYGSHFPLIAKNPSHCHTPPPQKIHLSCALKEQKTSIPRTLSAKTSMAQTQISNQSTQLSPAESKSGFVQIFLLTFFKLSKSPKPIDFNAFHPSRDINTTVSTWIEMSRLMSTPPLRPYLVRGNCSRLRLVLGNWSSFPESLLISLYLVTILSIDYFNSSYDRIVVSL